jgi:hypothetical protein
MVSRKKSLKKEQIFDKIRSDIPALAIMFLFSNILFPSYAGNQLLQVDIF